MRVQRITLSTSRSLWLVIDQDSNPIKPITDFIRYLDNIAKSPNTIKAYAYHLRAYWLYMTDIKKDWKTASLDDFAGFIAWLRVQDHKIIHIDGQISKRTEATINVTLAAVSSFYDYHNQMGNSSVKLTKTSTHSFRRYKPLLHHINKLKPVQSRLIKLKQPKVLPKVLSEIQIRCLLNACGTLKERLIIAILYETGMRIGQLLNLYHEDIKSWDNEINIVPKNKDKIDACNKSKSALIVHVSKNLMHLYSEYLMEEYPDTDLPHVFLHNGKPINYSTINAVFRKLSKKTAFKITPHMLRHTHATELIKAGWDYSYVQKRLGHSSIQTTIANYLHLSDDDMKKAFIEYQNKITSHV